MAKEKLTGDRLTDDQLISHTRNWIVDVVIGCNFCPFAAREIRKDSVHYLVLQEADTVRSLQVFGEAIDSMNQDHSKETFFIILATGFESFDKYLELVGKAEAYLDARKQDGIYQVASFHPDYLFVGTTDVDPANYTNRSPYPMLHLLREASVSRAVDSYPGVEHIPDRNIAYAQQKGLAYMQSLQHACKRDD